MLCGFLRRHLLALALLVFITSLVPNAHAQCLNPCTPYKFWTGAGTEFSFADDVPYFWQLSFGLAADEWNLVNSQYNLTSMYMYPGNGGLRIVVEVPHGNPDWDLEFDLGANVIRINPVYMYDHSETQRKIFALHEFGHQQGFEDLNDTGCNGQTVMSHYQPVDFTMLDWCSFNTYYDPLCEAGGGADEQNHCTPLVLTFTKSFPRLSGADVPFDIAANGAYPKCAWTRRDVDAFLVLDRDGDGMITDGRELFGNTTPMSASPDGPKAWNGFTALGFFDKHENGGNGNGLIDAGDAVFTSLRLWFDSDRDGVSSPEELVSLQTAGVSSIGLRGLAIGQVDGHGNVLWFGSTFSYIRGGHREHGTVVDFILSVK